MTENEIHGHPSRHELSDGADPDHTFEVLAYKSGNKARTPGSADTLSTFIETFTNIQ